MQTINGAPKNKHVQCDKIMKEDKGILCFILLAKLQYFNIYSLSVSINKSILQYIRQKYK